MRGLHVLVVCAVVCLVTLVRETRAARLTRDDDEAPSEDGEDVTEDVTISATTENPDRPIRCDAYKYCDGTSFPKRMRINGFAVKCDPEPDPKERCCVPYAKHLVCYNIKIEGVKLNYDRDDYMRTTDFASLCQAMAEKQGRTVGKFSGASLMQGTDGELIWRYGDWLELDTPGTEQIVDIACEVTDSPTTVQVPTTGTDDLD